MKLELCDRDSHRPRLRVAVYIYSSLIQMPFDMHGLLDYLGAFHLCDKNQHLGAYPGVGACPGEYGIEEVHCQYSNNIIRCFANLTYKIIFSFAQDGECPLPALALVAHVSMYHHNNYYIFL